MTLAVDRAIKPQHKTNIEDMHEEVWFWKNVFLKNWQGFNIENLNNCSEKMMVWNCIVCETNFS